MHLYFAQTSHYPALRAVLALVFYLLQPRHVLMWMQMCWKNSELLFEQEEVKHWPLSSKRMMIFQSLIPCFSRSLRMWVALTARLEEIPFVVPNREDFDLGDWPTTTWDQLEESFKNWPRRWLFLVFFNCLCSKVWFSITICVWVKIRDWSGHRRIEEVVFRFESGIVL